MELEPDRSKVSGTRAYVLSFRGLPLHKGSDREVSEAVIVTIQRLRCQWMEKRTGREGSEYTVCFQYYRDLIAKEVGREREKKQGKCS